MGDILNNRIITPEDFEFLKSIGVPYTGYIKGIGYTCPVYMPAQAFRITDGNVQWNSCELHPLFYQAIDDSPERIFLSMGYTTEDIAERITHDNGNGTITVAVGNQSVTFPKEQGKINVFLKQEKGNHFIYIEVTDSKGNILLSDSKIIHSYIQEKELKKDFGTTNELSSFFNHNKETLDNINTGIGALGIGIGAKTELIDYAIRSHYNYSYNQFRKLNEGEKLIKEFRAIGRTGVKYLRSMKIIGGVGNIYSNVLSFMTLVFDDEKPYDKKLLKAALDVGFTVIGRFGPWGFAASSIYYLLDMYTDGFYFFNE